MIEHLVISGGCAAYIQTMGVIQAAEGVLFEIKNIKSIWAISSGTFVALFISLIKDMGYNWETINEYIIEYNLYELFEIDFNNILKMIKKKGLYDINILYGFLLKLFKLKDISIDITLKEYYDKVSSIELVFFSFELNSFKLEEISRNTYPDLKLLEAIYMSCSIPLIFSPIIKTFNSNINSPAIIIQNESEQKDLQTKCYIDAAIVNNYPIDKCLSVIGKENEDKVFGILTKNELLNTTEINTNTSFINYILITCFKVLDKIKEPIINIDPPYQIIMSVNYFNYTFTKTVIFSSDKRKELLETGRKIFTIEFEKWKEKGPI